MAVQSYRDLIAWQKGMDLAEAVYRASEVFPREETYGLKAQLRRSVVSIPSNIAEGHGRESTRDYLRLLSIAYASLLEVETQLLLAARFGYIDQERCDTLLGQTAELGRILNGLTRSLHRRESELSP
jgi:four helix bundle protein